MNLVRPSTLEDCRFVADNMRTEDIAESWAASRLSPYDALCLSRNSSPVCLTLIEPDTGNPAALLGVNVEADPMFGAIWLLGTPAIERFPITFLRHCKPMLSQLYDETRCEAFYNYTHKPNSVHHRWLKWLGFIFIREVIINDESFYEFVRLRG